MRVLFLLICVILTIQPGLCQKQTDFNRQLGLYFKYHKVDPIEGLYTISDDLVIVPPWYEFFSSKEHRIRDHWAKVAIIRDSTSLTRSYFELIIEAPNFKERELRAEYLRTKQNPNILISKQLNFASTKIETMMFEFDDDMLVAKYEYLEGDSSITLNRTYLKFYPKK